MCCYLVLFSAVTLLIVIEGKNKMKLTKNIKDIKLEKRPNFIIVAITVTLTMSMPFFLLFV